MSNNMIRDRLEITTNTLDDYQWEKVCSMATEDIKRNNIAGNSEERIEPIKN
jgi:hypothetical protein